MGPTIPYKITADAHKRGATYVRLVSDVISIKILDDSSPAALAEAQTAAFLMDRLFTTMGFPAPVLDSRVAEKLGMSDTSQPENVIDSGIKKSLLSRFRKNTRPKNTDELYDTLSAFVSDHSPESREMALSFAREYIAGVYNALGKNREIPPFFPGGIPEVSQQRIG